MADATEVEQQFGQALADLEKGVVALKCDKKEFERYDTSVTPYVSKWKEITEDLYCPLHIALQFLHRISKISSEFELDPYLAINKHPKTESTPSVNFGKKLRKKVAMALSLDLEHLSVDDNKKLQEGIVAGENIPSAFVEKIYQKPSVDPKTLFDVAEAEKAAGRILSAEYIVDTLTLVKVDVREMLRLVKNSLWLAETELEIIGGGELDGSPRRTGRISEMDKDFASRIRAQIKAFEQRVQSLLTPITA